MRQPCGVCGRPARYYVLVDGDVCRMCDPCEAWTARLNNHRDLTSSEYDALRAARKDARLVAWPFSLEVNQ